MRGRGGKRRPIASHYSLISHATSRCVLAGPAPGAAGGYDAGPAAMPPAGAATPGVQPPRPTRDIPDEAKLFVAGLPPTMTNELLLSIFSPYGEVCVWPIGQDIQVCLVVCGDRFVEDAEHCEHGQTLPISGMLGCFRSCLAKVANGAGNLGTCVLVMSFSLNGALHETKRGWLSVRCWMRAPSERIWVHARAMASCRWHPQTAPRRP